MVPSTGRSTASRAASLAAARPRASARPVGVLVALGEHPGEAPQQLAQDHPGVAPRPHERAVGDGLAHRRHLGSALPGSAPTGVGELGHVEALEPFEAGELGHHRLQGQGHVGARVAVGHGVDVQALIASWWSRSTCP